MLLTPIAFLVVTGHGSTDGHERDVTGGIGPSVGGADIRILGVSATFNIKR